MLSAVKKQNKIVFPFVELNLNFHNIFSFYLQFSRSQTPPVFRLSHMGKAVSMSNFKNYEKHVIFRILRLPLENTHLSMKMSEASQAGTLRFLLLFLI